MKRSLSNWGGLWLVVVVAAMANLVPATGRAQITFLNTWGSAGTGHKEFDNPNSIAVGPTGAVCVADTDNERVQVFDSTGDYLSTIGTGTGGSGNNQFDNPYGVAFSPTGTVYVADFFNTEIPHLVPRSWFRSRVFA